MLFIIIFFVSKKNTIAEFLDIDRTKWGLKHLGSTILEGCNGFGELFLKKILELNIALINSF